MELSDLVNGVEKDEDLRFLLYFFIEVFEDGSDDVLMHIALIRCDFVVIFDSFKSDLLAFEIALNDIVDVELNDILRMLFIETCELFLHSGRAGDNIGTMLFTDLEYLSQGFLLLLEDVVDLVDSDELTVVQFQIASLESIYERFRHADDDVSMLVLLLVHSADFELQLL